MRALMAGQASKAFREGLPGLAWIMGKKFVLV